MKKLAIAVIAGLVSASAFAAQGDILARFRVINIDPDVKTSGVVADVHADVDKQTVPELDFTYMITNNIGAELILATARHEVTSDLGSLGKINHLPPTLTLQYHFNPEGQIRPYVGAGINYTRFYNNDLHLPDGTKVNVDKNSWGGALQVGTDIAVNKDWFVNLDVKKIYIKTDVSAAGTDLGTLKINPWVFGIGVGTKF